MEDESRSENYDNLEPIQEESGEGSISINLEVVAEIVAMAAKEVPGVVSLASGGIKDDIAGLFGGRKDATSSVTIKEESDGSYNIGVKLILPLTLLLLPGFGCLRRRWPIPGRLSPPPDIDSPPPAEPRDLRGLSGTLTE